MEINYEIKDGFIQFKITGDYKDSEDLDKIKNLCVIPKKQGHSTILVDVTELDYDFTTFKRYELSEHWVKLCRDLHFVNIAILGKKEKMDEFSETVVTNRGGNLKLFTDKKQAIDWLKRISLNSP